SYHRGFIFSGVKVKAKHLRSQMDLLKIRPIPTRKAHQMVSLSCSYQYFDFLRFNKNLNFDGGGVNIVKRKNNKLNSLIIFVGFSILNEMK
ncbi:hypothetical protein, partial [Vibrio parahaemolyticus]|uniref:hypothetical protein n=3 Tax=Vibrio parahaemolyticus TaxID=670 RepID=UPI00226A5E6F